MHEYIEVCLLHAGLKNSLFFSVGISTVQYSCPKSQKLSINTFTLLQCRDGLDPLRLQFCICEPRSMHFYFFLKQISKRVKRHVSLYCGIGADWIDHSLQYSKVHSLEALYQVHYYIVLSNIAIVDKVPILYRYICVFLINSIFRLVWFCLINQ